MIKAFHIADLHLGSVFSHLDKNKSTVRKTEVELSFLAQIENAYNKGARVFLFAGDIFDSKPFYKDGIELLKRTFEKYLDSNFFVIFGNHDYVNEEEFDFLSSCFGENVYLFFDKADMYEFDEYRVYGISFSDVFQKSSTIADFSLIDDDKINIVLMHGDLSSDSLYNPISVSQIEKLNADYLALGHVHLYSGMKKAGKTYYCYPGTHEGKGFDETGEKGGVFLEIQKDKFSYEFIAGSIRRYEEIIIDAQGIENITHLTETILSRIKNPEWLYKIIIRGEISKDLIFNPDTLINNLESYCFFVKIYDQTEVKIAIDDYLDQNTLAGGFVREVKDKINLEPQNLQYWEKVLKKGLELLK